MSTIDICDVTVWFGTFLDTNIKIRWDLGILLWNLQKFISVCSWLLLILQSQFIMIALLFRHCVIITSSAHHHLAVERWWQGTSLAQLQRMRVEQVASHIPSSSLLDPLENGKNSEMTTAMMHSPLEGCWAKKNCCKGPSNRHTVTVHALRLISRMY